MKPICPYCGYVFDHDAPKGLSYKCVKCREFFNVGEESEKIIDSNEISKEATIRSDFMESQKEKKQLTPDITTSDKETLVETVGKSTDTGTEGKMRTPESALDADEMKKTPLPHRTQVPTIVRVYGVIIMVGATIGLLVGIFYILWVLQGKINDVILSIMIAVQLIVFFVFYGIGKGLKNGKRSAVYTWCLFAMWGISFSIAWIFVSLFSGLLMIGWVGLLYVIPIISAFNNWQAFSPKVNKTKKTIPILIITGFFIAIISGVIIGPLLASSLTEEEKEITFVEVIEPILNAQTVKIDIIIGSNENGPVIHDEVMGSRIRRTVSGINDIETIIDLEQQIILMINHANKTASYLKPSDQLNMKSCFQVLRSNITSMQEKSDFHVENQGIKEFRGKDCQVFVAFSNNDMVTIWADLKTALPLRIEQKTPNMQMICDNLQFDLVFDESRFSTRVSEGYEIQQLGFDEATEEDFIVSLRIWAKVIRDGTFPDMIGVDNVIKQMPILKEKIASSNLTEEQTRQIGVTLGKGIMFLQKLNKNSQFHYAGTGVKLGEADKPIFWYKSKGSTTYRVIYGDLSVKNVSPENLPE